MLSFNLILANILLFHWFFLSWGFEKKEKKNSKTNKKKRTYSEGLKKKTKAKTVIFS